MVRIKDLQNKLIQRIRPFVDAKNPGDVNDHETKVFEGRIKTEAEDLKLESFGVEVSIMTVWRELLDPDTASCYTRSRKSTLRKRATLSSRKSSSGEGSSVD
jgi:hypothetical protein